MDKLEKIRLELLKFVVKTYNYSIMSNQSPNVFTRDKFWYFVQATVLN